MHMDRTQGKHAHFLFDCRLVTSKAASLIFAMSLHPSLKAYFSMTYIIFCKACGTSFFMVLKKKFLCMQLSRLQGKDAKSSAANRVVTLASLEYVWVVHAYLLQAAARLSCEGNNVYHQQESTAQHICAEHSCV